MTYLRLSLRYVLATISIIILSFAFFFIIREALAWTNPSAAPPGGSGVITVLSGNVGIGTTPSFKLDISGAARVNNTNVDPTNIGAGAAIGNIYEPSTGFSAPGIGFGTGSGNMAAIVAGAQTMYFGMETAANTLNTKMTLTSGGTLTVGGGSGKITVGTIDPLYSIAGGKYATYLPGMIGQKEELTGTVFLQCYNNSCKAILDFADAAKGSDLWLFRQISDFSDSWQNLAVILSPGSENKVWYKKDPENNRLILFGQSATEVSYRLTAPRFDWQKWGNVSNEPYEGFVIPQ